MQFLSGEKELNALDDSAFWDGSYLLDGTIDRDGYSVETMTLNARLTPQKGGPPLEFEVSDSRTNLAEVVNQLAAKVNEALKVNSTVKEWDAADEASQYFDEAKWAYRWGLLPQAQAASESAWTLGKRTKEVAALRVRAYGENVLSPESPSTQCNLNVPAMPDESKLNSATRSLELFCQDATRTSTNSAVLDLDWFDLGLQSLRMSARFLEGFYNAAEMRRGNEEQLAELRSWARQTAALLITKAPNNRIVQKFGGWRVGDTEGCRDLEWLVWEEAGIWHEKPEDALPVFERLLDNGYHPEHLPKVIGWSWEDRKRAPRVLKNFIEELCVSTNPGVRLEGRFLVLLRTPDDTEDTVKTCEEKLFSEIWEQRRDVLDDPGKVSLLPRMEEAMRYKKYPLNDPNRRLEDAPLVAFTHRLRMDYLSNASTYNPRVFRMLFPDDTGYYSQLEAQELTGLMEDFKGRTRPQTPGNGVLINNVVETLQRVVGTNTVVAQRPKPSAVRPAENPLAVNFIEWKLKQSPIGTDLSPIPQKLILRGGKTWCRVCYLRSDELLPFNSPSAFIRVDLNTGDCDEIPFPPELGISDKSFEVTDDSLFVSARNHLARFRFRERTWETIPVPMEGGAEITALNGRLYLATGDSLLEVQPDARTVQILASARRRPAANELDSLWAQGAQVFTGWSNKVGVLTTTCLFLFDPGTGEWEKIAMPESLPRQHVTSFLTGQGIQLLGWDYPALRGHVRMYDFSPDHAGPELLLKQGAGKQLPASGPGQLPDQPRWQWPEPFRLDFPSFVSEGKCLWAFDPRKIHWASYFMAEEPVHFDDDRQATLLRFESGVRQALYLAIRFEKDGQPFDPFDPQSGKFWLAPAIPVPFWLVAPEGLIVVRPNLAGHWLISKTELEKRFAKLGAAAKEKSVAKPKTANVQEIQNGSNLPPASIETQAGGLDP